MSVIVMETLKKTDGIAKENQFLPMLNIMNWFEINSKI